MKTTAPLPLTYQPEGKAGIDLFRPFAALLVIAIHTAPFSSFGEMGDVLFTYCLGRIAVPFFLMVTGCFVIASGSFKSLLRYIKKNCLLYGAAALFYLPLNLYAGKMPGSFPAFFKALFLDGAFYHLWYFPAVIIGSLLVYLLIKGPAFAAPLYMAAAFLLSLSMPRDLMRNGFIFAPLFLYLGVRMAASKRESRKKSLFLLILFLFLLLGEGYATFVWKLQKNNEMYLFLLPVMYYLFQLLLSCPKRCSRKLSCLLRDGSLLLYLIHPAVIVLIRGFSKKAGLYYLLVENSAVHFLVTACCSTLAAAAGSLILWRLRQRKENSYVPKRPGMARNQSDKFKK